MAHYRATVDFTTEQPLTSRQMDSLASTIDTQATNHLRSEDVTIVENEDIIPTTSIAEVHHVIG